VQISSWQANISLANHKFPTINGKRRFIRIKQPTWCINNNIYFVIKLCMFRASSVPIIRSYLLYARQLVRFMQAMWPLPSRDSVQPVSARKWSHSRDRFQPVSVRKWSHSRDLFQLVSAMRPLPSRDRVQPVSAMWPLPSRDRLEPVSARKWSHSLHEAYQSPCLE